QLLFDARCLDIVDETGLLVAIDDVTFTKCLNFAAIAVVVSFGVRVQSRRTHVYDRWPQLAADVAGCCTTRLVETTDIDNVGFEICDPKSCSAARNPPRKRLSFV